MSDQFPSINSIVSAARSITDAVEREAYIQQACGHDDELRRRVMELLNGEDAQVDEDGLAATQATGEASPSVALTGVFERESQQSGSLIAGKYRLLKQIGEGGMGSVWAAEQREPVNRTVALKLIKKGMDSAGVLARFDAERQALALMDHPNIARIYDGGVTGSGEPYFVMELVKGEPITTFCDSQRLTPRQRLELFVPVCQAIQHAHHKGIIHRDIKPSNVLVTIVDDRPVPKVIDFGVAKATGPALTNLALDTGFAIVGTPQYMSPEQASMNSIDIDTRSDVYSLGILLYELLAGSTPFKKEELAKAGYMEILRVIREEEPPRPSTKLSTADALPSLSAARGTDPRRLSLLLRNELDWIVMRALEKDRSRRYETANAFAADISRYLHGEPVQAHPPSIGYRLQKFLRKNRGSVFAGGLVGCALIIGCIGTSLGMIEARRQTQVAVEESKLKDQARQQEAQQRELAEQQRNIAETQRVLAEQRLIEARKAISAVVNNIPNLLERVPLAAGAQKVILGQMDELLSTTSAVEQRDDSYDSSRLWGLMAVETRSGQQALYKDELDKAEIHYRQALRLAQEVYDGNPRDRAKAAGNLAMGHALLADVAAAKNQPSAITEIRESIRLREEALAVESAEDSKGKRRANLGNVWNRFAGIELMGIERLPVEERQAAATRALATSRTARQHLQSAIDELAESPAELATARRDQVAAAITEASIAIHAKDEAAVIAAYELAKSNITTLESLEPERLYYKVLLADVCGRYGDYLLVHKQDTAAAWPLYAQSLKLLIFMSANDVQLDELNRQRSLGYYRLGLAAESLGDQERVKKYFERAALLSDLRLREKSDIIRDPQKLIHAHEQLMLDLAWAGQADRALTVVRNIQAMCNDGQEASEKPWAAGSLARVAFALAIVAEKSDIPVESKKELTAEALETLRQAIAFGFSDHVYLEIDPDAAPLRRVDGFAMVLQELKAAKK